MPSMLLVTSTNLEYFSARKLSILSALYVMTHKVFHNGTKKKDGNGGFTNANVNKYMLETVARYPGRYRILVY